jgi:hypothetical protein
MKIVVNGREYASVDEMPAAERQLYESALASLTGDAAKSGIQPHVNVQTKTRIVVNGKEYRSLEELPPDLRRIYETATKSGANRLTLTASVGPGKAGWLVAGIALGAGLALAALALISRS